MQFLVLLCVGVALVAGDVSHLKQGYSYPVPSATYSGSSDLGTPQNQYVAPQSTGFQQATRFSGAPSTSYSTGGGSYVAPSTGFSGQYSTGSGNYVAPSSGGFGQQQQTGFVQQPQAQQHYHQQAAPVQQATRFNDYSQQQHQTHLEPIVTKSFFVHTAPEDHQEVQLRIVQEPVAPRKNYNVVFIKTPSSARFRAPIIHAAPQNEEKTVVYVLSKNSAEAEQIVIPAPAPAKPSKPEIFFLNYKNQQEADQKIQEIQQNFNGQNAGSGFSSGSSSGGSHSHGPAQSSFSQTRFSDESSAPASFSSGGGSGFQSFGSGSSSGSGDQSGFQSFGSSTGSNGGSYSAQPSYSTGNFVSGSSGENAGQHSFTSQSYDSPAEETEYLPANH